MQQAGPDWHAMCLRVKVDLYTTMPTFEAGVGIQSNGSDSVLQCTRGTFHAISNKGFLLCYSTQRLQQPERCSSFKDSDSNTHSISSNTESAYTYNNRLRCLLYQMLAKTKTTLTLIPHNRTDS